MASFWNSQSFAHSSGPQGSLKIFTDGSRTDGRTGGAVYCSELNLNYSFRLPDHCSVFLAEAIAIKNALTLITGHIPYIRTICIYSDSQTAV